MWSFGKEPASSSMIQLTPIPPLVWVVVLIPISWSVCAVSQCQRMPKRRRLHASLSVATPVELPLVILYCIACKYIFRDGISWKANNRSWVGEVGFCIRFCNGVHIVSSERKKWQMSLKDYKVNYFTGNFFTFFNFSYNLLVFIFVIFLQSQESFLLLLLWSLKANSSFHYFCSFCPQKCQSVHCMFAIPKFLSIHSLMSNLP